MSEHNAELVGHETTDAEIAPLVRFAVFLTLVTVACALVVVGLYKYLDAREVAEKVGSYPLAVGVTRPLPPAPRLQTYPFDDIKGLRRDEARILDNYAWVDKNAGVVRIPVERAIDILAEKGLPYRAEAPASGAAVSAAPPATTTRAAAAAKPAAPVKH